jgi:hypothetical protein
VDYNLPPRLYSVSGIDGETATSQNENTHNMNTLEQESQNYILVCVEKPTAEGTFPATHLWLTLTNEINNNPTRFAGFEKLGENEFLFPEKTHLRTALNFLDFCRRLGDSRLVCKAYRIHGMPEVLD